MRFCKIHCAQTLRQGHVWVKRLSVERTSSVHHQLKFHVALERTEYLILQLIDREAGGFVESLLQNTDSISFVCRTSARRLDLESLNTNGGEMELCHAKSSVTAYPGMSRRIAERGSLFSSAPTLHETGPNLPPKLPPQRMNLSTPPIKFALMASMSSTSCLKVYGPFLEL